MIACTFAFPCWPGLILPSPCVICRDIVARFHVDKVSRIGDFVDVEFPPTFPTSHVPESRTWTYLPTRTRACAWLRHRVQTSALRNLHVGVLVGQADYFHYDLQAFLALGSPSDC